MLRWHRRLVTRKWTYSRRRRGRAAVLQEIKRLVVRMQRSIRPGLHAHSGSALGPGTRTTSRTTSRAHRSSSSRASHHGPRYVFDCSYCGKRFEHRTNDPTLRAHKDKGGSRALNFLLPLRMLARGLQLPIISPRMIAMLTLLRCDDFSVSTLLPNPGTDRGSGDRLVEEAGPAPVAARRRIGNRFLPPPLFLHEPGRFQGTQVDSSRLDGCQQTLDVERARPQTGPCQRL